MSNQWYTNSEKDFHKAYAINGQSYDLEKMNFAKRLCSDDANLIEIIEVNASQSKDDNAVITSILKANKFEAMYRKQTEEMSANGTVGAYIRIDDAVIMDDNSIHGGKIKINYCNSLNIVPLTVENGDIIECAFTGANKINGKMSTTLVLFLINEGNYICNSVHFDDRGQEIMSKNSTIGLGNVKPFSIMRTAEVNNLEMVGYGYPKIWSAIPSLKIIDLTFTMWHRDLKKSDKLVLVNEKLCEHDSEGNIIDPNEQMKSTFVKMGAHDDKLPDEQALWKEYSPTIRIGEVKESMELALGLLSMSFGFGTKKYTFEDGRIVTATEYAGEHQESMQEINKQRSESNIYISDIVKAIKWFCNSVYKTNFDVNEDIMIDFDDSYIEDKKAITDSMRNDALSFGIPTLTMWYLMKKYNITEEGAKKLISEVEGDNDGDDGEE